MTHPSAVVICGANGAGKTAFARRLLPLLHPNVPFYNIDEIERESSSVATSVSAGREFLRRLAATERARHSFAIETTLASSRFQRHIPRWNALGYRVVLHYIELPSAEFALRRVARRVAAGGHDVPDSDVRRRFARGKALFLRVRSLADAWFHWYSDEDGLRLLERRNS